MSRYIDADELMKISFKNPIGLTAFQNIIKRQSSADVVDVVRCKDCKHKPNGYTDDDVLRYPNFPHKENNPCPCQVYEDEWYSWIPDDDFYCSYGERK